MLFYKSRRLNTNVSLFINLTISKSTFIALIVFHTAIIDSLHDCSTYILYWYNVVKGEVMMHYKYLCP